MLISCNCQCLINIPTRVTATSSTLIDHIYTNEKKKSKYSGVLVNSDLSDHYAVFTIIPKSIKHRNCKYDNYEVREMTNFVREEFLYELNCKLSRLFKNNSLSVNKLFDRFVSIFTDTVNQFASMRKATRKEKKALEKTVANSRTSKINKTKK